MMGNKYFQGQILMPASTDTKARWERKPFPPSCSYTPTAVHLYPNNFVPIPNLKRIFFLFIRLSSLFCIIKNYP